MAFFYIACRLLARALLGLAGFGRLQLDACATRLGEPDRDGLLGGAGAVLALADMSISSPDNSPACVEGALPSRASFRARSMVFFSGIAIV